MRVAVLAAWRDSPTRLREDAATEADLVRAGYRDRLLTELAQNAADAAAKAGVPGRLVVRLDGHTLCISNTGAPLDISGVHALTALRASAKANPAASVGRFGVGFTAVLSVSDDIEVRSTTGSLHFSRGNTWNALHDNAIDVPDTGGDFAPPVLRLAWPSTAAPTDGDTEVVLRLREDIDHDALLTGMRAEAVDLLLELPALHSIRIGDDELTATTTDLGATDQERTGLRELRITGQDREQVWWEYRTPRARWLLPVRNGRPVATIPDVLRAPTRSDEELSLPALLIADIPMQPDRRRLLPGAHLTELATGYSDFASALPLRDRLILVPTPGFARSEPDALLREALIRELQTHSWLPVVTSPSDAPSTAIGDVDSLWAEPFPEGAAARLESAADSAHPRSGAASADEEPGVAPESGDDTSPTPASLSAGAAAGGRPGVDSPSGREVSDDAASDQVSASVASPSRPSGSATGGRDDVAAPVGAGLLDDGVAVAPAAARGHDVAEGLGFAGGRALSGPAVGTAVPTRASVFAGLTAELAGLIDDVVGPLVIPELSGRVHSEALGVLDVHRLGLARLAELSGGLERSPQWWCSLYAALEPFVVDPLAAEELGALAVPLADGRLVTGPRTVVLDDRLADPIPVHWARLVHPEAAHPLLARLGARTATAEDLLSDPGLRAELEDQPGDPDTADAVLRLAVTADPLALPSWLGLLELPDSSGELLPADELLLPGAPLRDLLVEDSPFGTAAEDLVEGYGAQALRAVGVGWDFSIVVEADPTGPDHHLDDEDHWWSGLPEDPPELAAVRDLDLVAETAWPEALRQLASGDRTRRLLVDPDGYTAWWLRRHARVDGTVLGLLSHPADTEFAGLLTEFAVPGLGRQDIDALRAVLADPDAITPDLAAALLAALADPAKTPAPEVISRTHARLAAAVAADRLDLADLDLPDRVRALSGAVVDPREALVLDQPWFGLALPPERLVLGDTDTAPALATLLDLPLVSEAVTAEVLGTGRRTTWSAEPLGVVLRQLFTLAPQQGDLVVHDDLRIRLHGAATATVAVAWWQEGTTTHVRMPQAQAQD
ncbi:sacsin N-terminal ATP-binding-like domain-containing protein [Nocardia sp. CWNU-33]|uniref:sacsin N-terminal ATP-binding-like domain-containing protein n=1 Tax=Nocardia sp. CWNU-33 TaxID=3392117 RepID=UPI00398E67A7